jgi:hypothetical protein
MDCRMDRGLRPVQMGRSILESGRMGGSRVLESKPLLMEKSTKESGNMGSIMGMGF